MYEGDIIINPLPLGLDNKTIQLNLQKKVNDFLVEYYKNKNNASRYIPKLRVQDLERKVLEVLDYYGNTLTGKVFTSDGEYDYEVSTNNRFTNRYNYLLGNQNKTFNFEVSKVSKDSDNARMDGESEPSLKNTQNIISHQINNSNFNYYRNFSQNSNLNLCDVYNGESLPLCREKSSYTNIIVNCTYDEKSFFSCQKSQSNITEPSQDNLNKSHLKYVYYRNAFLNFDTVNKLYTIEPVIENIKIPSFQEFIDSNNLTPEFEKIIEIEYFLQWQYWGIKQCYDKGGIGCKSKEFIDSRLTDSYHLVPSCKSCTVPEIVQDFYRILDMVSQVLNKNFVGNFETLINADFSYEKFEKLKLLEYEQEYNKVKEYFVVLNDLIKETQWIFSDINLQRYEASMYESYFKNKLIDFGLDKIDLSNVDVLSDADKISLVNRMLLTNLNKGCSTFSYSQVDSSCDYYKNYILANEPELTKEYFYNLSLRNRFIRLYEIILMHQPSFYIYDEFYVRLKY